MFLFSGRVAAGLVVLCGLSACAVSHAGASDRAAVVAAGSAASSSGASSTAARGGVTHAASAAATPQTVGTDAYLKQPLTTHPHAVLEPPPSGSQAVAFSVAQQAVETVSGPLSGYEAVLALYTNDDYGTMNPDGSVNHPFTKSLVWAFIKSGLYSGNGGAALGPGGTAKPATLRPGATCTGVWLASARTGAYLMGFSDCN